jgi:flagellar basal-body rod modification protein FlgD
MITNSLTPTSPSAAQTQAQPASEVDPLANKDVFLQLLVAQLKYQDPENPADGTQFVTQLAQFTTLEQSTEMRDDLDSINTVLQNLAAPPAPSSGTAKS